MKEIKLRAHHILCLNGFQGYGYSEKFVASFTRIRKNFFNNSFDTILLINSADEICYSCPFFKNNDCSKTEVKGMDNNLLSHIPVNPIELKHLIPIITKIISDKNILCNICQDCSWKDVCLNWKK